MDEKLKLEMEEIRLRKEKLAAEHLELERKKAEEALAIQKLKLEQEKLEMKFQADKEALERERMIMKMELERGKIEKEIQTAKDASAIKQFELEMASLKAELEKEKQTLRLKEQETSAVVQQVIEIKTTLEEEKKKMLHREEQVRAIAKEEAAVSKVENELNSKHERELELLKNQLEEQKRRHEELLVNLNAPTKDYNNWKIPRAANGDKIPCNYCVATADYTPHAMAAYFGHTDCLLHWIKTNPKFMQPSADGQTPLHYAAAAGSVDCIEALLKNGADLTTLDYNGRTALFIASASNQFNSVAAMMQAGSREWIDYPDYRGDTPLHAAVCNGYDEIAKLLIATGANPNIPNAAYLCPVHLVVSLASMKAMVEAGADIFCVDDGGRSPIFIAAANNRAEIVEYLLSCDPERYLIDYCDIRGDTPLHAGACNGSLLACQFLLQYGCNPSPYNLEGLSPHHLAFGNGHNDIVFFIESTLAHWHNSGWILPPSAGSPGGLVSPALFANYTAATATNPALKNPLSPTGRGSKKEPTETTAPLSTPPHSAGKSKWNVVKSAVWTMQFDPSTGYNYYYNHQSGESTWEKPDGYDFEDGEEVPIPSSGAASKGGGGDSTSESKMTLDTTPAIVKDYVDFAKKYGEQKKYLDAGKLTEPSVQCMVCNKRLVSCLFLPCEHACVCDHCIKKHNIGPQKVKSSSSKHASDASLSEDDTENIENKSDKPAWTTCPCCMNNITYTVKLSKNVENVKLSMMIYSEPVSDTFRERFVKNQKLGDK
jgi:ankyrin repeat protein